MAGHPQGLDELIRFRVERELKERFRKMAITKRRPMSSLLKEALWRWVEQEERRLEESNYLPDVEEKVKFGAIESALGGARQPPPVNKHSHSTETPNSPASEPKSVAGPDPNA